MDHSVDVADEQLLQAHHTWFIADEPCLACSRREPSELAHGDGITSSPESSERRKLSREQLAQIRP